MSNFDEINVMFFADTADSALVFRSYIYWQMYLKQNPCNHFHICQRPQSTSKNLFLNKGTILMTGYWVYIVLKVKLLIVSLVNYC